MFIGVYMCFSLNTGLDREKLYRKRKDIGMQYFLKVGVYAFLVVTNLIQFFENSHYKLIEGDENFQLQRKLDMEREIDEEILKKDQNRNLKKLPMKVIERFTKKYPNNIALVKEFNLDFDIFINTWKNLADRGEGYKLDEDDEDQFRRIDTDRVVDFFM